MVVILNNHELEREGSKQKNWEVDREGVKRTTTTNEFLLRGMKSHKYLNWKRKRWVILMFPRELKQWQAFSQHRCHHLLHKMGCFQTFKKGLPLDQQLFWVNAQHWSCHGAALVGSSRLQACGSRQSGGWAKSWIIPLTVLFSSQCVKQKPSLPCLSPIHVSSGKSQEFWVFVYPRAYLYAN